MVTNMKRSRCDTKLDRIIERSRLTGYCCGSVSMILLCLAHSKIRFENE